MQWLVLGKVIEVFQEVRRALLSSTPTRGPSQKGKKFSGGGGHGRADSSKMFAEIASRGSYQAQLQADLFRWSHYLKYVIWEIQNFRAGDMEELTEFVKWMDRVLDRLSDQTAVMRKLDWPWSRFEAFREAVGLHKELEEKKVKFRQWEVGRGPRADELKMMQKHMVSRFGASLKLCLFHWVVNDGLEQFQEFEVCQTDG